MPRLIRRYAARGTAFLALPVLVATALSACASGTSQDSASNGGSVHLSFSFLAATGSGKSPYQEIAKQYTKSHPQVTFDFKPIDSSSYGQLIRTQLQAGNAPDLMYVESGRASTDSVLSLAQAGYLLPLDGQPGAAVAKKFGAELFTSNGKLYGQPFDVTPAALNINQSAAKALGLKPMTSLDDVYANCATAAAKGKSLIVFAGAAPLNGGLAAMELAATDVYRVQPDWDAKKSSGEVSFATTPGWTQVLQTIVDLSKKRCFQPGAAGGTIPQNVPAVAAGTSVGSFSRGDSLGLMIQAAPQSTFQATIFPATNNISDARLFLTPINAVAINAKASAPTKKAAIEFLAWLADKKNADAFAKLSANLSIQATSGSIPAQYEPISKYLTDSSLYSPLPYITWPNHQVYQDLGVGVQGLLTGQTTIPKLLAQLDASWGSGH